MEDLPVIKLQTTLEREPDFLKLVYDEHFPEGRIMHLEFESSNETYMEMRMLEYCGILYRKFKKPVEQHLIFMGDKLSTMKKEIAFLDLSYKYTIHNLSEISYKTFIDSDEPEEVILSILADRNDLSPEAVIQLILSRLILLRGDSLATRKFIKQLEIISKMRNLHELTLKIINDMSISYDITTDVLFKRGLEQGLEQGKEEGKEEGATIKAIIAIRNMLQKEIVTDSNTIALILDISKDFVETTKEALKQEAAILKALTVKRARVDTIAKKFKVSKLFVTTLRIIQKKENK